MNHNADTTMTLEQHVAAARAVLDDLGYPAIAAWKAAHPGGKAIATFPVYVPAEVIHAAGMLPVGVHGAGGRLEIDHADSRIQSFVCSIARSTLELGLQGKLDGIDGFFFPSICDVARNLSGVWHTNFPRHLAEYIHLPQNMSSAGSRLYYANELRRLAEKLAEMGGFPADAERLRASVALYNENRRLVRALYAARREEPWKLSMYELFVLGKYGTQIPVEEHNALLARVLVELERSDRRKRDALRVVVEGSFCEQPPLELLQVLEEAGCAIVDDDLLIQNRWFHHDVPLEGDPFDNLAAAYLTDSVYSSVRHYGDKPRKHSLVQRVRAAKADGVVFCAAKFCEPALLDYVVLKDQLEKEGINYIAFEFEEKMGVFESIRTQIETFVESILFFT